MSFFSAVSADAVFVNRLDPEEILGTCSNHGFSLEDEYWVSAEHYYQATKYRGPFKEKIRNSDHPLKARKLGRGIFRRKRPDWEKVRDTVMTRAIYTKCRAHEDIASALLETGDKPLANNAYGEYYWGVGRDGRGENRYGLILQNVRARLRQEAETQSASTEQSSNE